MDATFACAPGSVATGAEGTGHLSHLGRVEITGGQCNNFATLELTDDGNGWISYDASNRRNP